MGYKRVSPMPVAEGGTARSTITAHNLIIGNGTGTPALLAPSATSGVPLVSQGASSDPAFTTAVVAGGGTGRTTLTNHNVLIGNTTSAVTFLAPSATSGVPLVSQGASSDPAFTTAVVAGGGTGRTTITSRNLMIGAGTSAVTLLAPNATSGIPLVSQGAASDPAYTTAVVAGGGTGKTSVTAYAPICGGTTTTGVLQSASTGQSTSGYIFTSTGSSSLPSFQGIINLPATTSTLGQVTIGGNRFLHAYNDTGSTYIGTNAGNFTLTGTNNAGIGYQALNALSSGISNVAIGSNSMAAGTVSGSANTAIGYNSLNLVSSGSNNTAVGSGALASITTAGTNTALGYNALNLCTGASNNAMGYLSLSALTSGTFNVGIGDSAGINYTSSESHNVCINNSGTVSESNVLRIGSGTGTGTQQLNAAYISGINGITVTGTAVLISSSDQLGIAVSSARFKDNIEDMNDYSSTILKLRPVMFNYNNIDDKSIQTGLIAEEVEKIIPSLVVHDKEGNPQTVKYHDLPSLILNELQKAVKRIDDLEYKLGVK